MTDATDADKATTAIHADELNQLVAAARSKTRESIPPIVMILDRPRSVIDGLVQSAGRTATRLVTLTKFRALSKPAALPDAMFAPPEVVVGEIETLQLERSPRFGKGSRPLPLVRAGGVAVHKAPIVDRYLLLAFALVVFAAGWLWLQRH